MDTKDYLSTRSNFDLPFRRARRTYHKISNWCIVVSAGTLLWSIGNFDKFIIKAPDGITEYMPYKFVYILLLSSFFASTAIFTFLRGYVYIHDYYDTRLRDITDIEERMISSKSGDIRPPLSKSETKFFLALSEEYHKGYNQERPDMDKWGRTKRISDLRNESISKAVEDFGGNSLHLWKSWINLWLGIGIFCYSLGMIISFVYVICFIWHFYDPKM